MGDWQLKVVERGTGKLVGVPRFGATRWARRLDDMTTATTSWDPAETPRVRTWHHELEVWGAGRLVWAGPIVTPARRTAQPVTITARDLWMRVERLFVAVARDYEQQDLGLIFGQILTDALAQDPGIVLDVVTHECGTLGDRVYEGLNGDRVADKLRELARTAVDWTIVGRQLFVGGPHVPGRKEWQLRDPMCDEVSGADDGLSQVNDAIVTGGRPTITTTVDGAETTTTGATARGRWRDDSSVSRVGLLQVGYSEPLILDDGSAAKAARTRVGLFNDELADLQVTLKEGQYDPDDLVPGSLVDVQLSEALIPWGQAGAYTLTTVDGRIDAEGAASVEVGLTQQDTTA